MKRKHIQKLIEWKNQYPDMPYMLIGARQVGKTFILKEFCAKNFQDYIYVNLDDNNDIRRIFEDTINPDEIIKTMSLILNRDIDIMNTVIFFDEIQVSERAISSLKYFNESDKAYKIVCAGSLLGVAMNRFKSSFPVGKVMFGKLYPMDLEEFLWAIERTDLNDEIKAHFESNKQMPTTIHNIAMQIYKDYLFVGGMPASILEYLKKEKNTARFNRDIKRNILNAYIYDMSKYTTSTESIKINRLYRSVPRQLNKENSKFTYKIIEEGAKRRYYETSIDWLQQAELVNKCVLVENPQIPLKAYMKDNIFKIYMNDTGLLSELSGLTPADFLTDSFSRFKGMITENYIAQALTAGGHDLYYWRSQRNAEVDFLLNINGEIIPMEVKSATNTKAKSINVYKERYNPGYVIKVSAKNFGFENGIKSVPLYTAYLL